MKTSVVPVGDRLAYRVAWEAHTNEVIHDSPTIVTFGHWNLRFVSFEDGIAYYEWEEPSEDPSASGDDDNPFEEWNEENMGHAVTGVGYRLGFDPDGGGARDWMIVHDNWSTTPLDVAVPVLRGSSEPAAPLTTLTIVKPGKTVPSQLIQHVPDANQPPPPIFNVCTDNFCAPMATTNVLAYWSDILQHPHAVNVTGGLAPEDTAVFLSWFMATNSILDPGCGRSVRQWGRDARIGGTPGTHVHDITPGVREFLGWDAVNDPALTGPNKVPFIGKDAYKWEVGTKLLARDYSHVEAWMEYIREIDEGLPTVTVFSHWNIHPISVEDGIAYYGWDQPSDDSSASGDDDNPFEEWNDENLGHAVTGVGYILDYDPDGRGARDWMLVHDNWYSTPETVAVPFFKKANFRSHTFIRPPNQKPGDCNQDGRLDIADAVCLFGYLFRSDPAQLPGGTGSPWDLSNLTLLNVNGDDRGINIADPTYLLKYLFVHGAPPAQGTDCIRIFDFPDTACRRQFILHAAITRIEGARLALDSS